VQQKPNSLANSYARHSHHESGWKLKPNSLALLAPGSRLYLKLPGLQAEASHPASAFPEGQQTWCKPKSPLPRRKALEMSVCRGHYNAHHAPLHDTQANSLMRRALMRDRRFTGVRIFFPM